MGRVQAAWLGVCVLAVLGFSGCASYTSKVGFARQLFESGNYDDAATELKKLADKKDNDVLLYLLELGMVHHASGRYQEAIDTFKEAEKIAVLVDYTSVSQEVSSVLLNDATKAYKGEDFEKILINVYMAIDYTLLGRWESALVECRRVNQKLGVMIAEGKMPYQYNSFAKYLSASLFESQREWNDAFVDYRTVRKWQGDFSYLPGPLMRVADRLKALEELQQYHKEYPNHSRYRLAKNEGEVILLLEEGKAPYKIPDSDFNLIPLFVRSSYNSMEGVLRDDKNRWSASVETLFDIEETAIKELAEKKAMLVAKKVGGVIAKRAAAYGVGQLTKSKDAEFLSFLLLRLADQADLRSWLTLPARLRVARLTLPAGRHDLVFDRVGSGDNNVVKKWERVLVKPGQIHFLNLRVF